MESVWQLVEGLWKGVIDLTSQFVIPDWAALIGLLPIGVLLAVVAFFGWILVRYRAAGPTRRGPGRVAPVTPDGIHMPGPSFAPVLVAVGAFLFFFGLLLGTASPLFWIGLLALFLTLIYWLREGMRDYDRIEAPAGVPALTYGEPPEGIHLPGPSFRPLLFSAAAAVMFAGLVAGPAMLIGGVILLFITLVGWLGDAGREYRSVLVADSTGHLVSQPAPSYPIGTVAAFVLVVAVAAFLSFGGRMMDGAAGGADASGGTSGGMMDGSSGMGGGGTMGGGSAGGSAAPAPAGDLTITAQNIQFDTAALEIGAGKAFTIAFVNDDAGVPHNVAIHKETATGELVFQGEIFNGVDSRVYEVPALDAGTYAFVCTVHPNMAGTLTAK